MTDQELSDILLECYGSLEILCKTLFPRVFFRPFSALHREIFKVLEDDSLQKVVISAPRGFGKSSIVNMAYPARNILWKDRHYVVPISASAGKAIEMAENLKSELRSNPAILTMFGDIKSQDDPFSKTDWVTQSGIKVLPRGAGQQIRGSRHDIFRPDLFICDDLEDDEAVESEEQREKLKRWFFSSVMNSVDRGSDNWRIIVIGTVLHHDSLLVHLLNDPSWHAVRLELCDDNCKSNWPEYMTDEQVKALYDEYKASDMLDVFYREQRGIPIALDTQGFRPSYFKYYDTREEQLNRDPDNITVVLCDPAKTMTKGSCYTALAVVTVNNRDGLFYIRDVVEDHMTPTELYDQMFRLADLYNAMILAPEVTGLNEYITYPLKTEMAKRGLHYVIVEVKPREGKTGPRRSGGLIPLYRRGSVLHNKNTCGPLERRLVQWPRPDKWDVIDAVSGILFVMEEGERYFEPLDDGTDDDKEYDSIENEEAINMQEFSSC